MRLRFHIETDKNCLLLLQSEPQYRTICVDQIYDTRKNNYKFSYKKLAFPYINFTIRYIKQKNKFIFPGYNVCLDSKCSLYVGLSDKPIKNINDNLFASPTDRLSLGAVCTDHDYDMKSFDTLEELTSFAVSHWWELPHLYTSYRNGERLKIWEKLTLEDMGNFRGKFPDLEIFSCSAIVKNFNLSPIVKFKNRKW